MSRSIALDTIYLRHTPRLAHTEYSLEYHKDYIRRLTGLNSSSDEAIRAAYAAWDIDFLWTTNDGLHDGWAARGRATDMGHAEYAADASDRREARACPFRSVEEVWAFDPAAEYGLPGFPEQVAHYERVTEEALRRFPDQLSTGGYYKTIVSGAIEAFGWEMLLLAAADRVRMERVLDRFFRFTLHHMRAWAETSAPVIIQHDDFVWASGPFMAPAFYRGAIIPRYAELWKPLRAAGKKVLFCSDGNFVPFAKDVVNAGADGLIFEPCNDFGWMAERFGGTHVLVGSYVDCRDLAFGTWEQVRGAIDRTIAEARNRRGILFAVGNHMPPNIPGEMMDSYIAHLRGRLRRQ